MKLYPSWILLTGSIYHYRLVALSEDVLMKMTNVTSLLNIEVLNLHDNGLVKVKELQSLPLLKKLIISFNELTRLDDVAQLVCTDHIFSSTV